MSGGQHNLRQEVLELLRILEKASAREVCDRLNERRPISVNAVATVLNRLVDQGLLARSGRPRHYVYEAKPVESAVKERAERTVAALLAESGELGLVHFVEAMHRIQPESIEKLEAILARSRSRRS